MMRKEICRNFQRGSCRYGDKCKFLHATSQQPKANMFGFGTQTGTQFQQSNTQQQPNPFGFGVQKTTGSANSGASKQTNLFKPFENKWTRSSSVAAASSPSLQQPSNQSQAANHQCSDPESCKRIIAEDFEHEKPLWKLTCYGHYKYLPCDITGDISYEELRAVAYDDGKRGINLQSIVERERSLLNSKLNEFQSLLLNPYSVRSSPAQFTAGPFPPAPASISSPETQPSGPPSVSSFSQLGASLNMGLNTRLTTPSNNSFGQFQNSNQAAQASSAFAANSMPFSPFGSQVSSQIGGNSFTLNQASPQAINTAVSESTMLLNGPTHAALRQEPAVAKPLETIQKVVFSGDASIWLKEEWKPGEIPEQAPPDEFIR
ncbi:hypothetical protein Dimus_020919 [Dionaea muscipula]